MEVRPSLSMGTSGAKQISHHGHSRTVSSSLQVFESNLEGRCLKFPESQQLSMESNTIPDSQDFNSFLPSNSAIEDPIFQPTSSYSINNFYYPVEDPTRHSQVGSGSEAGDCEIGSDDQNNWRELADHLLNDDDDDNADNALTCDWQGFLVDENAGPKIQLHQQSSSSTTTVGPSKQRMRWTPELHEAFVEAVNKLGGSESVLKHYLHLHLDSIIDVFLWNTEATPKGVLKMMQIEGLTIYHIKSHLQKYRATRYRPESSEATGMLPGSSEKKAKSTEEFLSLELKTGIELTEALRLQVEVQKRLHEQLEIQRNLQLRLEEQGRYLQMIYEKQCKQGGMFKALSSSLEDESGLSRLGKGENENAETILSETPRMMILGEKKRKAQEIEALEN